jgi:hypothetical protein
MNQTALTHAHPPLFALPMTELSTLPVRVESAPLWPQNNQTKWTWSCRNLLPHTEYPVRYDDRGLPQAGDVAMVRVENLGYHIKLMTAQQGQLRLYPGDQLVGVFGHRYATDAYEAQVVTLDNLSVLTNAGMIGTVLSKHQDMKKPTFVTFLHYLTDEHGQRLNLKRAHFHPKRSSQSLGNIILVVGSGMNSGKTTTMMKLTRSLLERGVRVAACKLTGSVSTNDRGELCATGAHFVTDFSDYGFPSTYLCGEDELHALFHTMMADAAAARPDVTVVEIADGLLQRETRLLLESPVIQRQVQGVVMAATCASSAIFGLDQLHAHGHQVVTVSGIITNSPLFMRELMSQRETAIASSAGNGEELAQVVMQYLELGI